MQRAKPTLLFAVLTISVALLMYSGVAFSSMVHNGPREDDLIIYFYEDQESAYTALATGEVDFMLYSLSSTQVDSAVTNPALITAKYPWPVLYQFELNNNYSIIDYPGIRSPMNYTAMRQAVAFLADKEYYVDSLLSGLGVRIDQPIAAAYYGWANASLSYPYYPYEYSPAGAKAVLDSKFPEGTTINPDYDPLEPLSSQYLRTFPADHALAGQDLYPLKFCVRTEHMARRESGRGVVNWLKKLGVPINSVEGPSTVLYSIVMDDFNYHFYTGGWSFGSLVPRSLLLLYHSINAFPGGSNYVTGGRFPFVGDNATDPRLYRTHPKLDALLYNASWPASFSDAVKYTMLASGYMTENCVTVPLWTTASLWAWSNQLLGMVNQQGGSLENDYTFMNAYKADGSPIRCGSPRRPFSMNVIYADGWDEYCNLNRISLYGGVDTPAYNRAANQGGFVRDWETTTWNDNGETKTKVVMTFRSDGYFVKPASGDQGRNVNATHYFASAWFYYQIGDGWASSAFIDLHHVDITSSHTFEIYFDTYSYWNIYWCQSNILPIDSWASYPEVIMKYTENHTNPVTPSDINLSHEPFWIERATLNGTLLNPFTDYNIVKGKLHVSASLDPGILEVKYWALGDQLHPLHYTVGDLPWQVALEGAGMYYCTSLTPGVGGNVSFKRNPYYWMETPPLGEIDFARKQVDGKLIGSHKVDIFDLVLAASAYGGHGSTFPSANWVPGVDVAPPAGRIDIFDIVTIARNYGRESDSPE